MDGVIASVPNDQLFENKFLSIMSMFETKLNSALNTVKDNIPSTLEGLAKEFYDFKDNILRCLSDTKSLLDHLDARVEDLESYSRRNCLLIHGINEELGDDTDAIVVGFLNTYLKIPNFSFEVDLLDRSHRLERKRKVDAADSASSVPPRPIIVKLVSYRTRRMIWTNKKLLKGTKFLITESLTAKKMQLLYNAAKEAVGPRNVWMSDGRIFASVGENNSKRIFSLDDLPVMSKPKRYPARSQKK